MVNLNSRAALDQAFDVLRQGLAPYISRRMKASRYGSQWWRDGVEPNLSNSADRKHLSALNSDKERLSALDTYNLLHVIRRTWNVFQDDLGQDGCAYIDEVYDARNRWAHQEPITIQEATRYLDTIARLLEKIKAKGQDDIRKLADDLLREHYGQVTPEPEKIIIPEIPSNWIDTLKRLEERLAQVPATVVIPDQSLPDIADFTGRKEQIAQIEAHLSSERNTAAIIEIVGMAGAGKSTLATRIAHRLKGRFPDGRVYLDLRGSSATPLSVSTALTNCLRAFRPMERLPESEGELAALLRSTLSNKRVLFLLDDAANAEQVQCLLPAEQNCAVIITSRHRLTLPGIQHFDLDTFTLGEARDLLSSACPRLGLLAPTRFSESSDEKLEFGAVDQIARLCGYLPLALRHAASALTEHIDLNPADYIQRLQDTQTRLKLTGIEASLKSSYDLLTPEMQKWWRTLTVFPGTFTAPAAAAVWGLELETAQDALGVLVEYSLLEWDPVPSPVEKMARIKSKENEYMIGGESGRYHLHELARLFAEKHAEPSERADCQCRHAAYYLDVLVFIYSRLEKDNNLDSSIALADIEWENIQTGQAWAAANFGANTTAADLCATYAVVAPGLLSIGRNPDEIIEWLKVALQAARQLQDTHQEAVSLKWLGMYYGELGKPERAVEYCEQSLAIYRAQGDREGESETLTLLGHDHLELGQARRAIEFFEQSLTINRELGNRRDEGEILHHLARAYLNFKEYHRAIECYEQSLAINRELGNRRNEGQVLYHLAEAYLDLEEYPRAVEFAEHALAIFREIHARRDEANALTFIGAVHFDQEEFNQSISTFEQALALARAVEDDAAESFALVLLTRAYMEKDEPRRAIEFQDQYLRLMRERGNRQGEIRALWNLGIVYCRSDEYKRAIEVYESALSIACELKDHREEGEILNALGDVYSDLAQPLRATEYYKQVLPIFREARNHTGEGIVLWNMAWSLEEYGDRTDAITHATAAVHVLEQAGDDHAAMARMDLLTWPYGDRQRIVMTKLFGI